MHIVHKFTESQSVPSSLFYINNYRNIYLESVNVVDTAFTCLHFNALNMVKC